MRPEGRQDSHKMNPEKRKKFAAGEGKKTKFWAPTLRSPTLAAPPASPFGPPRFLGLGSHSFELPSRPLRPQPFGHHVPNPGPALHSPSPPGSRRRLGNIWDPKAYARPPRFFLAPLESQGDSKKPRGVPEKSPPGPEKSPAPPALPALRLCGCASVRLSGRFGRLSGILGNTCESTRLPLASLLSTRLTMETIMGNWSRSKSQKRPGVRVTRK